MSIVPMSLPVSPSACTLIPMSMNSQLRNSSPAIWSNTIWWLRKSLPLPEYAPENTQLTNVARASPLRESLPFIVHRRPAGLANQQPMNTRSSAVLNCPPG